MLEEVVEGYRMSPQQRRVWLLRQSDDLPYRALCAVSVAGDLDAGALRAAVARAVERHEALRTTFHRLSEMAVPLQVIVEDSRLRWREIDLTGHDPAMLRAAVDRLFDEERGRRFDLTSAPLLHVSLARLSASDHLLVLSLPALAADARTLKNLAAEIVNSYDAGAESDNEPTQYLQFSEWQNETLEEEATVGGSDEQPRHAAQTAAPAATLACKKKHAEGDRFKPASVSLQLGAEMAEAAKVLAGLRSVVRRTDSPLSALMLACWQTLLARLTRESEIVVGYNCDGRKYEELESALGLFAKFVPVRCEIDESAPFDAALAEARRAAADAYERQEYFAPRHEAGQEEASEEFSFEFEQGFETSAARGATFSLDRQHVCIDRFKLKLSCLEVDDSLAVELHYDAALYDGGDAERIGRSYVALLSAVVENSSAAVGDLKIITDAERRLLVEGFNDTRASYASAGLCLHQLFEQRARIAPEATALVFRGETVSYAELNARANRLARRLRDLGVGAEVRVGVLMERSVEMVASLLAVLKAGGAYVPLDPSYPAARLNYMLDDARAPVLLTQGRLAALAEGYTGRVFAVDAEWDEVSRLSADDLAEPVAGDTHLAYVIYTSGSTGQPKGAMLPHRGVVNCLAWMQETYRLDDGDRFLLKTSLNFDPSVWELFWPLWVGATVVVAEPERHQDTAYLVRTVAEQKVTSLYLVPSLLRAFLEEPDVATCRSLRHVICGGESLPSPVLRLFYEQLDAELHHSYGPTETSIASCEWQCDPTWTETVPIGKPLGNTQSYVLDGRMQPAPVGVPGELYIGGECVGRGYLGRAALTAERFIPNVFADEAGSRLYRTGDLVRWLEGGDLEFLGRVDHQVKIRGQRVELGEIESVLKEHPAVGDAAVVVRENKSGEEALVGYVTTKELSGGFEGELRLHLAAKLPAHMVPSEVVLLESFPLTPGGKVDRRALPAPEEVRPESERVRTAPRTPVEEMLAGIWQDVLRTERVGIHDNFFALGGHSLLATQLMSRLRRAFGLELPLRQLFESPTVAELASHVETALRSGAGLDAPPIVSVTRTENLPLSFAQQRLWFIDQLQPGAHVYNVPVPLRLTGSLDAAVLAQALSEVVRRHESLRTTFAEADGQPVQLIHPPAPLLLHIEDLSHLEEAERKAQAEQLATEEAQQPFDLGAGPLLRARLLRLSDEQHILLFTMHHIISDGWSMGVLVREVTQLYEAYLKGEESPLAELSIQYADFAVWQREWMSGEVLERELNYWRQQLAGAPPVLELPTDKPRPAVQSFAGARHSFSLPGELAEGLRKLSRAEGATLFMTLLAGFQSLLARYSGQNDIVVGSPIAGRNRAETESLIGFFVNTLALRTDLSGDPNFRQLLARVREVCLGAYAHQDVPFEKLVEELAPERSLSHTPLFQVMFAMQNAPGSELESGELRLSAVGAEDAASGTAAKFDLTLTAWEAEGGEVECGWSYNTEIFETETVARLTRSLLKLLAAAVECPEQPLSSLSLLSTEERHQLLVEWNDTARDYPRASAIATLFEQQAERRPDAVALVFQDDKLTYAELNRRANVLARQLRALGVGADVLVGLCVERSPEMIAALLAVLKAGGAYLPLDPAYPRERLAFMLEDAGARIVLTERGLLGALPETDAKIICLDEERPAVAGDENLGVHVSPDNLAYVAYTSGSTGRPKGVAVSQRNVVRLVRENWFASFDEREVFLQFAPVAFDASTFEIWGALLNGARLAIMPPGVPSLEELGGALGRHEVTTLWLTAGLFHLMVDERLEDLKGVRQMLAGGDVLSVAHVRRFLREAGEGCTLVNGYGPTENTTFTCCQPLRAGDRVGNSVPLGRPIANTRVYILDERLQPVAPGAPGELCTGGDGLARGYVNRPALTAERFIPDPFSAEPGARLYRTGDLARYLADGRIEFLGRRDEQVKVRGFRIELGEIESVLAQHHALRDAAVIIKEDASGDKRLIAFLRARQEPSPSAAELRGFLLEKLPDYMIPSVFVSLETWPLTTNGKLDRKALNAHEVALPESSDEAYAAPGTPAEEMLVGVWAEVLGLGRVGIHDNFFDAGGHSLLATQLMSRVRAAFGVDVPLRLLFESPTVAELARHVESALRSGAGLDAPPIVSVARTENLPLSFAQQRLWFLDQLEPGSAFYNVPTALRLTGSLDAAVLAQALSEVVRRHESLRTTFAEADGQPVQLIHPPSALALPVEDLGHLDETEREAQAQQLATEEAQQPFDLAAGPLLRVRLLRLSDEQHILLFTMHHIISDGWSMGVLIREVTGLYEAYLKGEASPLAELSIQYADFAVWQREWMSGEVLERELNYWRQQLAGAPPVLELPTDRPRPPVQSIAGARHAFLLPGELSEALRRLSREEGVTLFMTLLAAWQALLSRYSGQGEVVVGSPIAGRNRAEVEPLIGFFVNTLALRTELSGDPSFGELLRRVREVCLGAYAHQDVPFERLVEELQPERSLSHTPLFQALFTLQNHSGGALALPGLSLEALEVEDETAKFDLSLYVTDEPEQQAATIVYNSNLFDAETIGRMAGHFEQLLRAATSDRGQKVLELPLLTVAERRQLLTEFNDTHRALPLDKCVHQLFEEQVERTPGAVAAVYGGQSVTYDELNARANRLARHLVDLGVGSESLVALLARRSIDFLTAMLAVFKAGGAYLPLDPAHPPRRLGQVLSRSGSELILAADEFDETLARVFAEGHFEAEASQPPVVGLEDLLARAHGSENLPARNVPGNLAYVIYTSGSTGMPKGAMLEQRGMCNHLWAKVETLGVTGADVVAQTATQCFDVSVWQMLTALLAGGRTYIADEELALDSIGQLRMIAEQGITILEIVPSQLRVMVDGVRTMPPAERPDLSPLRWLIVNGEPLLPELCRQWFDLYPATPLINAYGPTECSDDVTQYAIKEPPLGVARMSIGSALPNMRMYVLDKNLSPVPVGVGGELYIGGVGVGRGYRAEPERTAQIFIPDFFGNNPGARLYKTGDLVRYLPDGNLDFLQRVDHQVKVRGFRIELGEVETALCEHASVTESVCVVREEGSGVKRLVAYVAGERVAGAAELAAHLRGRLPEYMVPSAFVTLDALPLTPNGKVDRRALPEPDYSTFESGQESAPRTPTEEMLAGVWAEVLGLGRVGIHDNFFDAGGHSLLATQLMSRVRATFGIDMPLRLLFESPTVAELARHVESALRTGAGLDAPPIVSVDRGQPLPLSFAQQRLWFIDQLEPGNSFYNVPAAVRLSGQLSVEAVERSLTEVVRRHESLRTTFKEVGGEPVQVIGAATEVRLEIEDLSHLAEEEREAEARLRATQEARRPFDLSTGPLLRARLLRLGAEEHVLLFTMHHIVSDGWSMGVLVREVTQLYEAYLTGTESPLAELTIQYADFAVWQRRWMSGEVLERELDYWRRQLGGELPVLALPTDRPRPAVQSYKGRHASFMLSAELSASLEALSRRQEVTMFMLLLAAWKVLLSRYTQQEEILIGTAIANRNHAETEPLIGFFINMLVLRTDLAGDPAFAALLKRVRETALGAYAHQDVPFEKLIEEIAPARDTNQAPLVQAAFGFNNAPREELKLPGLTLNSLPFEDEAGRFDLTLWFDKPEDELRVTWYFNTSLFDASTIERMQGHFETLLRSIVASPDARLSELEMLTEEEKQLREAEKQGREEVNRKKLRSARRKFVSPPQATTIAPAPSSGSSDNAPAGD